MFLVLLSLFFLLLFLFLLLLLFLALFLLSLPAGFVPLLALLGPPAAAAAPAGCAVFAGRFFFPAPGPFPPAPGSPPRAPPSAPPLPRRPPMPPCYFAPPAAGLGEPCWVADSPCGWLLGLRGRLFLGPPPCALPEPGGDTGPPPRREKGWNAGVVLINFHDFESDESGRTARRRLGRSAGRCTRTTETLGCKATRAKRCQ